VAATARRRRQRIEDVVAFALNHKTRVQILIVLNEGTFSASDVARIIDEPLNRVSNHMREMADDGSIELVKTEPIRNALQHYYRAVEIPEYSAEETAAMTPEQRRVTAGLIIQSMVAEMLASLSGGKMDRGDERICLAWDWLNVDTQGREEIADVQEDCWRRLREVEVDATNRRSETGEPAISLLVSLTGFERARKGPEPPRSRNRE
jgi:DNA-binding transcriptional ArsR family regulator